MAAEILVGLAVAVVLVLTLVLAPACAMSGLWSEMETQAQIMRAMEQASANGDYPADAPDQDGE